MTPFVVCRAAPIGSDRLVRLADVLVTTSDGQPRRDQFAALFRDCPGLTLVLLAGENRTVDVGFVDGVVVRLRLARSVSVRLAAVVLYQCWVGQFGADGLRAW